MQSLHSLGSAPGGAASAKIAKAIAAYAPKAIGVRPTRSFFLGASSHPEMASVNRASGLPPIPTIITSVGEIAPRQAPPDVLPLHVIQKSDQLRREAETPAYFKKDGVKPEFVLRDSPPDTLYATAYPRPTAFWAVERGDQIFR
eukprot:tig00000492_g1527.t1